MLLKILSGYNENEPKNKPQENKPCTEPHGHGNMFLSNN